MMQPFNYPFNHEMMFSSQLTCHMKLNFRQYWQCPTSYSIVMFQLRLSLQPWILHSLSKQEFPILVIRISAENDEYVNNIRKQKTTKGTKIYLDFLPSINSSFSYFPKATLNSLLTQSHNTVLISPKNPNIFYHGLRNQQGIVFPFDNLKHLIHCGTFTSQYLSAHSTGNIALNK